VDYSDESCVGFIESYDTEKQAVMLWTAV